MITFPYRWLAAAGAVLVLLVAIWWHGNRAGARGVQAAWDAERAAAVEQRREDAAMQRKASAGYQTEVATMSRQKAGLQKELRNALSTPVPSCPGLALGDLYVPAGAIRVLRDAGADPSP